MVDKPEIIKGGSRVAVILGPNRDKGGSRPTTEVKGWHDQAPTLLALAGVQQMCVDRKTN